MFFIATRRYISWEVGKSSVAINYYWSRLQAARRRYSLSGASHLLHVQLFTYHSFKLPHFPSLGGAIRQCCCESSECDQFGKEHGRFSMIQRGIMPRNDSSGPRVGVRWRAVRRAEMDWWTEEDTWPAQPALGHLPALPAFRRLHSSPGTTDNERWASHQLKSPSESLYLLKSKGKLKKWLEKFLNLKPQYPQIFTWFRVKA